MTWPDFVPDSTTLTPLESVVVSGLKIVVRMVLGVEIKEVLVIVLPAPSVVVSIVAGTLALVTIVFPFEFVVVITVFMVVCAVVCIGWELLVTTATDR